MSLKDILVHLDGSRHASDRLDAASRLASLHDAHLIGVYGRVDPRIPDWARAYYLETVRDLVTEDHARALAAARDDFERRTRRAGISAEWRAITGDGEEVLAMLIEHARYVDLAILGQRPQQNDTASVTVPGLPDQAILDLGRPALIIPYIGARPTLGEHILVAWQPSRLSTRALHDALPLMHRAKTVTVLTINPGGEGGGEGGAPGVDICRHLARHGVKATATTAYSEDVSVGDMILSRAAETGSDLLVAGAWGHARWRELVLGGVTRHLLRCMTLPVLMSH